MWSEALDAKFKGKGKRFTREQWDQLLGDYDAVADVPAICFSEDLIAAYPEAKVVLVERDEDKWFQSFDSTVIHHMNFRATRWINRFFTIPVMRYSMMSLRWAECWFGAHTRDDMRAKARQKYREHYKLVREVTPPGRLLEYKVKDGWGPLCEFLGKPIPAVPFPHVNDSDYLHEHVRLVINIVKTAIRRKLWVLPVLSP